VELNTRIEVSDEVKEQYAALNKLYKGTFETDLGKELLKYLKETYVDTSMARPGDDLLTIGLRQGQANVINNIIQEVNRG